MLHKLKSVFLLYVGITGVTHAEESGTRNLCYGMKNFCRNSSGFDWATVSRECQSGQASGPGHITVQKKTCAGFLHRTFVAYLCKFLVPETDKTDMADNKFDTNEDSLKAAEAGPPFNSHTFVRLRLLQGLICLCVSAWKGNCKFFFAK